MTRKVFTHQPVAMARIPLRPLAAETSAHESDLLAEGVFLASRSLSHVLDTSEAAQPQATVTLRAYEIRSRTRTTPHGVFSGVSSAVLGGNAESLHLGARSRVVTSPSPAWLAGVADRLLDNERVLAELSLTANNLVTRRGDRLEVEQPAAGVDTAHVSSIRATDVSLWLLNTCQDKQTRASDLLTTLTRCYPEAGWEAASGALRQLIRSGLLLTDLLPADLAADPLAHLLRKLPSGVPLRPTLDRMRELLTRADSHLPGTAKRLTLLHTARQVADEVLEVERPLAADTIADATLTLPRTVGDQAAQAASVLWQVGHLPAPAASYHEKFLRAYGHHRMIPLLEVIDPAVGIGPPGEEDRIGAGGDIEPRRAAVLARMLGESTAQGLHEVVLNDDLVRQLAHGEPTPPPQTAEIQVRLLRQGDDLRVAVCPNTGSQDAGSAAGRFARQLPHLAPDQPPVSPREPLLAEIVCRSRTEPTAALAVETGFAPHRIPLGVPERDGDVIPQDLTVVTTGQHLVLWSTRHRRPVTPVLFSRLAQHLLPPAARTLQLIGQAGARPWHTWSWGPAGYAPFTPRVRYRQIVLAPARWTLPEELTRAAEDRAEWNQALTRWQVDTIPEPPETVVAEESDRHLLLDLDRNEDRELLRRCVHRGARTVTEPLGGTKAEPAVLSGPDGRHITDLVVGLTRQVESTPPRTDSRATTHTHSRAAWLPGSPWLSLAVPVPATHQDTVLRQLPDTLAPASEHIARCFWLRYHSIALGEHLRIRLHGHADALNAYVLPLLTTWCSDLHRSGLASRMQLEPYEPETERYGGPKAITLAEEVFATDSALAVAYLTHIAAPDDLLTFAALSATEVATTLTTDPRQALRGPRLSPEDRSARDALRSRTRTVAGNASSGLPGPIVFARAARHEALENYRVALAPDVSGLCASDLVHMHCNRLLGVNRTAEAIARSLAIDLLHTHAHKH